MANVETIRYTDGNTEHLTADQVRELSYTAEDDASVTQEPVPAAQPARNVRVAKKPEETECVNEDDEPMQEPIDSLKQGICQEAADRLRLGCASCRAVLARRRLPVAQKELVLLQPQLGTSSGPWADY